MAFPANADELRAHFQEEAAASAAERAEKEKALRSKAAELGAAALFLTGGAAAPVVALALGALEAFNAIGSWLSEDLDSEEYVNRVLDLLRQHYELGLIPERQSESYFASGWGDALQRALDRVHDLPPDLHASVFEAGAALLDVADDGEIQTIIASRTFFSGVTGAKGPPGSSAGVSPEIAMLAARVAALKFGGSYESTSRAAIDSYNTLSERHPELRRTGSWEDQHGGLIAWADAWEAAKLAAIESSFTASSLSLASSLPITRIGGRDLAGLRLATSSPTLYAFQSEVESGTLEQAPPRSSVVPVVAGAVAVIGAGLAAVFARQKGWI